MASTISTPPFGTFKRFKMQYVAAAAGVALATAAVVGGLTLRNDASAPAPRSVTPITVSDQNPGSYPLVQEMSHPAAPAAAPSDSTTDIGSYPLVQEMSHPGLKSNAGFDGVATPATTEIYILSSLDQRTAIEQELSQDGEVLRAYWVIDSPEGEEALALLNAELAQFGDSTVTLIDVR